MGGTLSPMSAFWPVFGLSFVIAALLAPVILKMLVALKSRQTVSQYVPEHAAKQGTPTMGGIIIAKGFAGSMILVLLFGLRGFGGEEFRQYYLATLVLFVFFSLIGFVDDFVVPRMIKGKRGLGWTQKLVLEFVGVGVFLLLLGRQLTPLEMTVGVLSIIFFANAYNFSDGLDWLAGSLLLAISLGLGIIATFTNPGQLVTLGALCGGALPFMWLNKPPAKVFMGDVGSLPIGATLGLVFNALAMPAWRVGTGASSPAPFGGGGSGVTVTLGGALPAVSALTVGGLLIIAFVMAAELIPVPLQILSVKLRNKRIFPATPIHHSFQRAGWKETRVVGLFVGVQLLCSLVGAGLAWAGRQGSADVPAKVVARPTDGLRFSSTKAGHVILSEAEGPLSSTNRYRNRELREAASEGRVSSTRLGSLRMTSHYFEVRMKRGSWRPVEGLTGAMMATWGRSQNVA